MQKVLFIESNTSGTGEIFMEKTEKLGLSPVLLTHNIDRYARSFKRFSYEICDTSDLESMYQKFLKDNKAVEGVYSSSEYFVHTAAILAERSGLSGANPQAIAKCRSKWETRNSLKNASLATPRFRLVSCISDLSDLKEWKYPLVFKPISGSGSVGVKVIDSESQMIVQGKKFFDKKQTSPNEASKPFFLCEEFIDGKELSVETFGYHGQNHVVGVVEKHLDPHSKVLEVGHDFPSQDQSAIELAIDATLKALDAVGLNWGAAHTEVKICRGRAYVIEINPRLAGGFIPDLIEKCIKVDLIKNVIALVTGQTQKVSLSSVQQDFGSIRFLIPQKDQSIKEIQTPDFPKGVECKIYEKYLANFEKRHGDFTDRVGHISAIGENSGKIKNLVNTIQKQVKIIHG